MRAADFSFVTILGHIANRAEFVRRPLRYYDTVAALKSSQVPFADGGDPPPTTAVGRERSLAP